MGRQYFDNAPIDRERCATIRIACGTGELRLTTGSGVFSYRALDRGTDVLLRTVPPPPPETTLLDLGCGYGPIALCLAAQAPTAQMWAVDVNHRALDLTRRNAAENGIGNVAVASPEAVPPELRFARIYSNPPIRIGKAALHSLLLTWLRRLQPPDGRAYLVIQRHLGADSTARWLDQEGFATLRLRSKQAYRVLQVGPRP